MATETMERQPVTLNPSAYALRAELRLSNANGDNATTAPVRIVARSGQAIDHPYWGRFVHDFSGMTSKPKIVLDYEHCDPIGYLNRFDISSGDLVCSGAITPFDDDMGAEVIAKMQQGVPYEASIQFGDDFDAVVLPEGMSMTVNSNLVEGPALVITRWELKAVAVCKLGADSNTSAELLMSEKNKNQKKVKLFLSSKEDHMSSTKTNVEAVESAAPVAAVAVTDAPKALEAETKLSEETQVAEVANPAVEVTAPAETEKQPAVSEGADAKPKQLSATVVEADPRAEARMFMQTFGELEGTKYFAAGLSLSDATQKHLQFQNQRIQELSGRLAAIDRGAKEPVQFKSENNDKQLSMQDLIRLPGQKK